MNPYLRFYVAELIRSLSDIGANLFGSLVRFVAARRYVFLAIVAVVCMTSLASFAVEGGNEAADGGSNLTSATVTPSALSFDSAGMFKKIGDGIDMSLARYKSPGSSPFQAYQDALIAFFVMSMTLWALIKMLAGGQGLGELMAELVPIFMSYAMVYALLNAGGVGLIESFMNGLVTTVTKVPMDSAADILHMTLGPMFKNISQIFMKVSATGSFWENPGAYLATAIPTAIMKLATAFLMLISGALYAATAMMAMLSITLVCALAPVMVPFLIFTPMSWVFDSWLKFLLGASMLKLVGGFLMMFTNTILSQLGTVAAAIAADAKSSTAEVVIADIVLHGTLLLIVFLATLVMAQAPSIATGLLSGSAGGAGFSSIKAIKSNGITSLAGKGYQMTGGRFLASRQGAKDAAAGLSSGTQKYRDPGMARAYQVAHQNARRPPAPPPGNQGGGGGGGAGG